MIQIQNDKWMQAIVWMKAKRSGYEESGAIRYAGEHCQRRFEVGPKNPHQAQVRQSTSLSGCKRVQGACVGKCTHKCRLTRDGMENRVTPPPKKPKQQAAKEQQQWRDNTPTQSSDKIEHG